MVDSSRLVQGLKNKDKEASDIGINKGISPYFISIALPISLASLSIFRRSTKQLEDLMNHLLCLIHIREMGCSQQKRV